MPTIRLLTCCVALALLGGCGDQPAKTPVAAPAGGTTATPEPQKQLAGGPSGTKTGDATSTDSEMETEGTGKPEASASETTDLPGDEAEEAPEVTAPAKPKTEGAIAAAELAGEFDKDEAAADKKYQGKTVVVEGKVGTYLADNGYIYLTGSNDTKVICILAQKTDEPIKYGDTVAVKGKYDLRAVLGVSLKDCELLAVNP